MGDDTAFRSGFTTFIRIKQQFDSNHLGHFALTGHLLSLLRASGNARVMSMSSLAARFGGSTTCSGKTLQPQHGVLPVQVRHSDVCSRARPAQPRKGWGIMSNAAQASLTKTNLKKLEAAE